MCRDIRSLSRSGGAIPTASKKEHVRKTCSALGGPWLLMFGSSPGRGPFCTYSRIVGFRTGFQSEALLRYENALPSAAPRQSGYFDACERSDEGLDTVDGL